MTFINKAEKPIEENPNKGEKTPQTGDNSIIGIWIALFFVSVVCVAGATIYSKKRKYSEK